MSKGYRDCFSVFSKSSANLIGRFDSYTSQQDELLLDSIWQRGSMQDKAALLQQILDQKIHGIAYSPYIDGQSPGVQIPPQQISERLEIVKPYVNWIRSFSCVEGNQETPRIAHEQGIKVMVGVSLGEDRDKNEVELANGIEIARAGHADILAVGNEVLLRGDMSEDELLGYIERAKHAVPTSVTVGYVDAYFLFEEHPRITQACDTILINCYPFWEGAPVEYALPHMKEMHQRAVNVANGKKVIISETGWPSVGTPFGAAVPGRENALDYFISTYLWANEAGIDVFYFSSFDESWKVGDEGDVGAYWGLWGADGQLKYTQ